MPKLSLSQAARRASARACSDHDSLFSPSLHSQPPPATFLRPRSLTVAKTCAGGVLAMPGPVGGVGAPAAAPPSAAAVSTSLPFPAPAPPPRYVALAGVILRWFGHWTEEVPPGMAADRERVRVRKVEVRLHLVVS